MPRRPFSFLVGVLGLLFGSLAGAGCTPDSSGSPPPSETSSTTPDTTSPSTQDAAPRTSPPSSPTSAEDERTVAERLKDASLAARVKQALVRTQSLRPFDFAPTVSQGHLTLRGDVETREQYQRAERVASAVGGVTAVTNQVTVQGRPVSNADADSSPDPQATYHTVRRGETLIGIARAYDVSVQQLRALNDLRETLQPGQEIRVR